MVTPSEFDTLIGSSWLAKRDEERERFEDERAGSANAIDDAAKTKRKTSPLPPLGESVGADAFVKRHPEGHGDDGVTELDFDPLTKYPVTLAGRHPVLEHERVRAFYDAIVAMNAMDSRDDGDDDANIDERASKKKAFLSTLGASMFASHASYGALGLGDAGTDFIVGMVRDGRGRGQLHGAKITGGGSGGTVCVLGEDDDAGEADYAIEDVRARYARRRMDDENLSSSRANANALPHLFRGSSPGAASYGYLALRLDGA